MQKNSFEHISILPNMPPMQTILNSIRLGYSDAELTLQGLGVQESYIVISIDKFIDGKEE